MTGGIPEEASLFLTEEYCILINFAPIGSPTLEELDQAICYNQRKGSYG